MAKRLASLDSLLTDLGDLRARTCTSVSQCLCELLCLRFSVFEWTLVLVLAFLSVCMDSCVSVSQCLYGLLC